MSVNPTWSTSSSVLMNGLSDLPYGLVVDQENGTVFVADTWNHRIICLKPSEEQPCVVLDNLKNPMNVLVDKETKSIIVADCDRRRVVRYHIQSDSKQVEKIIDHVYCTGLSMDVEGAIYVSDIEKHYVKRYSKGSKTGDIVAGGHGIGESLDKLNTPLYITVDYEGSVYVSDWGNHRVVKWPRGAQQGILVAGFDGSGSGNTQLHNPCGILIDMNGNLYVADHGNNRIVRYRKNQMTADILLDSNQIKAPLGLCFDSQNNLYVTDKTHRVLRFTIDHNLS